LSYYLLPTSAAWWPKFNRRVSVQ